MARAHEARVEDVREPLTLAIVSSNGKQAMLEHARALKARGVPTLIDPSHALPILDRRRAPRADPRRGGLRRQRLRVGAHARAHRRRASGRSRRGLRGRDHHQGRAGLDDPRRRARDRDPAGARGASRRPDRLRRRLPRRPAARARARPAAGDRRPARQPARRATRSRSREPRTPASNCRSCAPASSASSACAALMDERRATRARASATCSPSRARARSRFPGSALHNLRGLELPPEVVAVAGRASRSWAAPSCSPGPASSPSATSRRPSRSSSWRW